MFDKIKAVLVILIFAYVGYIGWKTFSGKPLQKPSFLAPTPDSSKEKSGENAEPEVPENLTPLQEIRLGLSQVEAAVFSPLNSGKVDKSTKLKRLWDRSAMEFKHGKISESDAKTLSALIMKLNECSKERKLYVDRYDQRDELKGKMFNKGMGLEEKKRFATKELNRQWGEWVEINRQGTRTLLHSLSQ